MYRIDHNWHDIHCSIFSCGSVLVLQQSDPAQKSKSCISIAADWALEVRLMDSCMASMSSLQSLKQTTHQICGKSYFCRFFFFGSYRKRKVKNQRQWERESARGRDQKSWVEHMQSNIWYTISSPLPLSELAGLKLSLCVLTNISKDTCKIFHIDQRIPNKLLIFAVSIKWAETGEQVSLGSWISQTYSW